MWSALAFGVLNWYKIYPPELRSTNLDFDWFYRRAAPRLLGSLGAGIETARAAVTASATQRVTNLIERLHRYHGPEGVLAGTWAVGSSALWAVFFLGAVLIAYFS